MALKGDKEFVTSGKKKASVRKGDRCSFRHETRDRAQKPEHTAATPFRAILLTRSKRVEEKKHPRQK